MNAPRVVVLAALGLLPQQLCAESPAQTLADLRQSGASTCVSGGGIAMTVGRKPWKTGNEGLSLLRHQLPKSIRCLSIFPIDGEPLSDSGLSHIASAPDVRILRFYDNAIDAQGILSFVQTANENPNRPRWLVLTRVTLTAESIKAIAEYKDLQNLQIRYSIIPPDSLAKLKQMLPDCKVVYTPSAQ